MKNLIFITIMVLGCAAASFGQEGRISNKFGLGFQLNQYQKDFGMGINFTSPYFVYDRIAVRARANLMFNEHLQDMEITWTPYANVSLGVIGTSGYIGDFMRLYGEGGVILILPSSTFSDGDPVLGGYGHFGFEFYMSPVTNYFIELGGIGTGAVADKVAGNPIYSNGFSISVGFRFHL